MLASGFKAEQLNFSFSSKMFVYVFLAPKFLLPAHNKSFRHRCFIHGYLAYKSFSNVMCEKLYNIQQHAWESPDPAWKQWIIIDFCYCPSSFGHRDAHLDCCNSLLLIIIFSFLCYILENLKKNSFQRSSSSFLRDFLSLKLKRDWRIQPAGSTNTFSSSCNPVYKNP